MFSQLANVAVRTCFRAFLLCFCEGEMSFPAGTGGDEHRGCGEDGCDCSLEGTSKNKQARSRCHKIHFLKGGVHTCFPCCAFVSNETQTKGGHKEEDCVTLEKKSELLEKKDLVCCEGCMVHNNVAD